MASPYWPSHYRDHQHCTWIFTAPPGSHIVLSFEAFDTESCCDCLTFYPGKMNHKWAMSHKTDLQMFVVVIGFSQIFFWYNTDYRTVLYCLQRFYFVVGVIPKEGLVGLVPAESSFAMTMTKMGEICFLRDVTQFSLISFNFYRSIIWFSVQNSCGGSLQVANETKLFASQNYPASYSSGSRCTWTFRAEPGQHIVVGFLMFDTEGCCDCLTFYPGNNRSSVLIALCINKITSQNIFHTSQLINITILIE